jgi:hypothetical protein
MGHEDEGDAERLLQRLQFLLHLFAQLQIERAERLVEQQDLGLVDQRPGERHALPLAAGKLRGFARAVAGQPTMPSASSRLVARSPSPRP